MPKIKGTQGAIIELLDVQTKLEVSSQMGKPLSPTEAEALAKKIEGARNMLQAAILAAGRILDEGV